MLHLHSGVSDNHVMVGVKLTTEFDSAAKSVEAAPKSVVKPILLPGHVVEMMKAERTDEQLRKSSAVKSAEELELKNKRDRLRFSLHQKRKQCAPKKELKQLQEDFDEAQAAYAEHVLHHILGVVLFLLGRT